MHMGSGIARTLSLLLSVCLFIAISFHAPVAQAQDSNSAGLENVNAAVTAARAATKDKHFDQSEAIMLKTTASHPELVLPWIELGLAQIGLKKYTEAETSFKFALGLDSDSERRAHADDFYQSPEQKGNAAPAATRASRNTVGGTVNSGQKRTPDLLGTGYASLGEIYIRLGRIPEAKTAFDTAVKDDPQSTALYRRNEMIFFFQTGNGDEQLKAAEQSIAIDPGRAMLYYFKAQAMVSKATLDPKTQKMLLPAGCAEAYQKYLDLDFNGPYSADAKSILAAAGIPIKGGKK